MQTTTIQPAGPKAKVPDNLWDMMAARSMTVARRTSHVFGQGISELRYAARRRRQLAECTDCGERHWT